MTVDGWPAARRTDPGPTSSTWRRPGHKRRQISKGGFATRNAAEAALSEVLTQAAHGDLVVGGRSTLGDYLAEWLTGMRVSLVVSAWTSYRSILAL